MSCAGSTIVIVLSGQALRSRPPARSRPGRRPGSAPAPPATSARRAPGSGIAPSLSWLSSWPDTDISTRSPAPCSPAEAPSPRQAARSRLDLDRPVVHHPAVVEQVVVGKNTSGSELGSTSARSAATLWTKASRCSTSVTSTTSSSALAPRSRRSRLPPRPPSASSVTRSALTSCPSSVDSMLVHNSMRVHISPRPVTLIAGWQHRAHTPPSPTSLAMGRGAVRAAPHPDPGRPPDRRRLRPGPRHRPERFRAARPPLPHAPRRRVRALPLQQVVVSPSRVSRLADEFVGRGWLERAVSPQDGRLSLVRLTPAAERRWPRWSRRSPAAQEHFLDHLSEAQLASLVDVGRTLGAPHC